MELLYSIEWYLTKINNAQSALLETPAPADIGHLRFNHGIYIESIFSLIDYMDDNKTGITEDIKINVGSDLFYFRMLRNSIVHRGFDLSTRGTVVNGNTRVLTPDNVVYKGEILPTPTEPLLLKATMLLDIVMRTVLIQKLNSLGALEEKEIDEGEEFKKHCSFIENDKHIPLFVKEMFVRNIEEIKMGINFAEANRDEINKLKDKLSPVKTLISLSKI
ncbi:hypothetical protein [Citrobacter sedlakii]|uniref:hypothetical protein n=1 Tax=Citrobacter sedlakii TaxID=67826 RepID=UPI001BA838E8|nr:hypothetical protein [Citrobacter sedlakii]EKJ8220380.1 hypothetical protein [Citrobacter sedlakii]QUC31195.1 hypothetical protein JY391_05400 [Citrobacter sedlakii]